VTAPGAGVLHVMRHRNFRLFWFGFLVSNAGAWIQSVAQGWLVYDISDNAVYLGLIGTIRALPLIALALVGGSFADRFDKKKLLYATQSVMMLSSFLLGLLTLLEVIQVWHVFLLTSVSAGALAFDQPARQSLVPTLVPRADMHAAITINAVAFQGATVFGPSLTGLLVPLVGLAGCFFVNTVTFLAVFAALWQMELPPAGNGGPKLGVLREIGEGIRLFRGTPVLLALVGMAAVNSFMARPYQQFITVFARDILLGGVDMAGYLTAAPGIGTILFSFYVVGRHDLPAKGRILLGAGAGFAAALVLFAWSQSFWLSLLLLVVVGGLNTIFMTTTNTLLQSTVDDQMRGRVMSYYTITALAMMPLGQGPMGVTVQAWGPQWAVTAGALVSGAAIAAVAVLVPAVRRML
jgi:MFS family permease